MTGRPQPPPLGRLGVKLLISGVALTLTGVISMAALVVQLLLYDPSCDPVAGWDFGGACGALKLLVLLMLPVLVAGLVLLARGLVLVRRDRRAGTTAPTSDPRSAAKQVEPRQKTRR
jgi:hypothetical protein